ncbi:MAG TPA: hypothetical protein VMV18_06945, partial [bacterium]|nr:hypothetical protein [bacterium]
MPGRRKAAPARRGAAKRRAAPAKRPPKAGRTKTRVRPARPAPSHWTCGVCGRVHGELPMGFGA